MPKRSFAQQRWWPLLLIAVISAVTLYWWFFLLEREEYEVDLGVSEAARRNPYLAAEKLLQARGYQVQVLRSFAPLDEMTYKGDSIAPNDLIILINAHRQLQGQRLENVWEWVNAGGNLVLSKRNVFLAQELAGEDAILARLSVGVTADSSDHNEEHDDSSLWENSNELFSDDDTGGTADEEADRADEKPEKATDEKTEADEEAGSPGSCRYLGKSAHVVSSAGPNFEVARLGTAPFDYHGNNAVIWREEQAPYQILRVRQGEGSVTANADNSIWDNSLIGCLDHAYALAVLAQDKRKVWFLINADAPSLWRLLWGNLPLMMALLCLALVLWLWAKAKRFAPLTETQMTGRRRFLEHLQASAAFLWRHKQGHVLIEQLRNDIHSLLQHRHPAVTLQSLEEQSHFIAARSGLPAPEVRDVLSGELPTTPAQFTAAVQSLQTIRNQL